MKVIKLWCHIKAHIKKFGYKIIFGTRLHIGRGTTWRYGFHIAIEGEGRIFIGNNCFFNNNCSVNSLNKIIIGDGTIFGSNCHIYDHNHRFNSIGESIKSQGYTVGETVIGSNCWFGTNVVVLRGVHIGDNVTIGAGCVISGDVSSGSVVAGENKSTVRNE